MPKKKQDSLTLFPEVLDATEDLTDEQFGALMRSAFAYRFKGERYSGGDLSVKIAFKFVASQIDRYTELCQLQSERISKRWNKDRIPGDTKEYQTIPNDTPILSNPILSNPILNNSVGETAPQPPPPAPKKKVFVPPTVEEVTAYCQERGNSVSPERFVAYYDSNGWMVGKNKMKDWKAAVRTWEQNGYPNYSAKPKVPVGQIDRKLDADETAAIKKMFGG